ncbi:unnamed protein product [Mucor hiemalis]
MLQEYPTQIQPRSSSTRVTPDVIEMQDSSNKVDAEASRILIDLANQDTSLLQRHSSNNTTTIAGDNNKFSTKQRAPSKGDIKVSLPIKTDVNIHLQQQQGSRRPDPIMLLAAAAAVIDDEGKYKGRSYERREIRLHGRHNSAKRKSYTYGSHEEMDNNKSTHLLHRRYSERRHRYQRRPSISMATDTWSTPRHYTEREEEEEEEQVKGGDGTHAFSWQYLSMKQNPRIKRNAMHAYITYMIYTDMAQEQQRGGVLQRPPSRTSNHKYIEEENSKEVLLYSNRQQHSSNTDWYNNTTPQLQQQQQQQQPSYRLPPSPRQRHDPPTTESIIGRPLTDFLIEGKKNNHHGNNNNSSSHSNTSSLLPLPSHSTLIADSSNRLPTFL